MCLQRGSSIWAEENDGGKIRGEPSRDFAKVSRFDGMYLAETRNKNQKVTNAFVSATAFSSIKELVISYTARPLLLLYLLLFI